LAFDGVDPACRRGPRDRHALRLCNRRATASGRTGDAANPHLVAAAQLIVAEC
jgi:hypothetical protein